MDAVWRILEMLASGLAEGEELDLFVLDFQEAFWQVPLSPAERRFFCAALVLKGIRGRELPLF